MKKNSLFIVDAMAMAFRNHHAFIQRPLTSSSGFPTSSLFGSAQFLFSLIQNYKPTHLVIASDTKEPTFRHKMYPEYKANRGEMPEELGLQIPKLFEMFALMGIKTLIRPGFEADDLIGTLTTIHASESTECFIVSGDKDFMQLINPYTYMLAPKKGGVIQKIGIEEVHAKFGCKPDHVIDALALIGDSSDNVPGVPGIGEKGASQLVSKYGNLDQIYTHLEDITNKRQSNALQKNKELAYLSKDLVTIKTDVDMEHTLEDYKFSEKAMYNQQLEEFFRTYDFFALTKKVKDARNTQATEKVQESAKEDPPPSPEKETLPKKQKSTPTSETPLLNEDNRIDPKYHLIDTEKDWKVLKGKLLAEECFSFDTETTGLDTLIDTPIGVSFALKDHQAYYLPLLEMHLQDLSPKIIVEDLKEIFSNSSAVKVAHNLKFDLQILENIGVTVVGPYGDSMIAAFLLHANERTFNIDHLSKTHLGISKIPTTELMGSKKAKPMQEAPIGLLTNYACEDAYCTMLLHELFEPQLKAKGLLKLYQEVEIPLIPILAQMEKNGIKIDCDQLQTLSSKLNEKLHILEEDIKELAGEDFNLNSPKQLSQILFEKLKIHEALGIKRLKKTKTGYSTDVSVLESMAKAPICKLILEYRTLTKLVGTYIDVLPGMVHQKTTRLHTHFHQTGTATGRLSSSHPNLQNIPIRTDLGKEIRKAFVADSDCALISADYSQIELRILAHLSGDKALQDAFLSGHDIHTMTAAKIHNKEVNEITSDERSSAKAINYGLVYGMGPTRLAKTIDVSTKEAKEFIERYFAAFPSIKSFLEQTVEYAKEHKFSKTLLGRRRPIDGLDGELGPMAQATAKNIATNSPIQGTAADLIKLAMIDINNEFIAQKLNAKILLQVHDELLIECPSHELDHVASITKNKMEQALQMDIPLSTSLGTGLNWLEAH